MHIYDFDMLRVERASVRMSDLPSIFMQIDRHK